MYYKVLAGRFHRLDLCMKVFLAITSSGTVAGWTIWSDGVAHPYFSFTWKALSGVSAIVAIAMPLFNYSKKVEWATSLVHGYSKIHSEIEIAWAKRASASQASIERSLEDFHRQEQTLNPLESHFPGTSLSLIRECQQAIIHKRGLTK